MLKQPHLFPALVSVASFLVAAPTEARYYTAEASFSGFGSNLVSAMAELPQVPDVVFLVRLSVAGSLDFDTAFYGTPPTSVTVPVTVDGVVMFAADADLALGTVVPGGSDCGGSSAGGCVTASYSGSFSGAELAADLAAFQGTGVNVFQIPATTPASMARWRRRSSPFPKPRGGP